MQLSKYKLFCKRYELDANSIEARKEYNEYKRQLKRLEEACKSGVLYRETN